MGGEGRVEMEWGSEGEEMGRGRGIGGGGDFGVGV